MVGSADRVALAAGSTWKVKKALVYAQLALGIAQSVRALHIGPLKIVWLGFVMA